MRLLQIKDNGDLSLIEFLGTTIPPYAILSHTWGSSSEEVLYQDILNNTATEKSAYCKITFCIDRATEDGLSYFWIDTCCIDKSSSAELSEAITSMFRWYQNSTRCYVYLQDVSTRKRKADYELHYWTWEPAFRGSRWFSRGWTLQELLAPSLVSFYSVEGQLLGDKLCLEQVIHEITRIPVAALRGDPLRRFNVSDRMSWAEKRYTTREEDKAYSLLGIFDISMSTIYGEGRERALGRLDRAILELSTTDFYPLGKEERSILLKSLQFEQIDARYMTIKDPHARTCEWILSDLTYLEWHDVTKFENHHGFLWIKGKPGTGKSTLMKSILANVRETIKGSTVVSFFFNARGGKLEKSTLGMYRSLLLQLLTRFPALQKVLDALGLANTNFTGHTWSIESLKSLMKQAIRGLGRSSLLCFVDAIDECEAEEVRDMIQFFESIGDLAVAHKIRFQTCFSSRYYPYISIKKGLNIRLEIQGGHIQDISNYVASELRIDNNSKSFDTIRAEIQQKASGIFMWVVLVVSILNKEYDAGRVHMLRRRIGELPSDLHELWRNIITRDSHYKAELLLCIQWVLFARYPLRPEQLYFAVLVATEPQAAFDWNPQEITMETIERFILNVSKGLVTITASPHRRVQFIHESLRDLLLKENELSDIWPELASNLHGTSHERLKHCCLMYLTMNFPTVRTILKESYIHVDDGLCKHITYLFPFLQYAVRCVWYHTDLAEESGITQRELLETFPLPQWIKMNNIYQPITRQHTEHASVMYILAELDMVNLINIHPSASRCLDIEAERCGCPLFSAIANGSHRASRACLEAIEKKQAIREPSVEKSGWKPTGNLRGCSSRHGFVYSSARGLLWCAAALGGEVLVTRLAKLGCFEVDSRDMEGRTPLWWATRYGWEKVVQLLLDNIVTSVIDIQDKNGQSALYVAVERRNHAVAKLLLDAGANVNAQGGFYGHPLQLASRRGVLEIVTLLLDAGADVNAQADFYGNALQAAAYGGYKAVVTLLLSRGADINAQGPWGSAVMAASRRNHGEVVTLLRNNWAI
jgi:hypothetical protein